jgi:translation initiation factor IF-1
MHIGIRVGDLVKCKRWFVKTGKSLNVNLPYYHLAGRVIRIIPNGCVEVRWSDGCITHYTDQIDKGNVRKLRPWELGAFRSIIKGELR